MGWDGMGEWSGDCSVLFYPVLSYPVLCMHAWVHGCMGAGDGKKVYLDLGWVE